MFEDFSGSVFGVFVSDHEVRFCWKDWEQELDHREEAKLLRELIYLNDAAFSPFELIQRNMLSSIRGQHIPF